MLCCIGGVCVPYTAVIPILLLAFKWVAAKLASLGILPQSVVNLLNLPAMEAQGKAKELDTVDGPSQVKTLSSENDFEALREGNDLLVCKFTAEWCQPCKKVQPFFEKCSTAYGSSSVAFVTIDVDDYDSIAAQYKVAMMPTFVVLRKDQVLGKYSGSSEPQLQEFLQKHLLKKECVDSCPCGPQ